MKLQPLSIISAASDFDSRMLGYYVASGSGETFRIYGWAATMKIAKALRADVRRNPKAYEKN